MNTAVFTDETELPSHAIPTTVNADVADIPHLFFDAPVAQPQRPPSDNFHDYTRSLPKWEQQLLGYFEIIDIDEHLQDYLGGKEHELFVGSDGGALPHGKFKNTGSQGWIIATKEKVLWKGYGTVFGAPDNCSFRTEAYGSLATLVLLKHLYKFWTLTIPAITLLAYTDSLSLMTTLDKVKTFDEEWYPQVFLWHHIDVIHELHSIERELQPMIIMRQHVEGHADEERTWEN
jgi:hypothetical protein